MTVLNANTFRVAGTATGGNRKRRNYSQLIGDDARVNGFFSLTGGSYTVAAGGSYNGLVTQIANRKTASALVLAEAAQTAQPSLDTVNGPTVGGAVLPFMRFFTSGADKLTASVAFPVSGDHFKAFVFRSAGSSSSKYLGYSGTTGNRHMMHLGATDKLYQRVGASGSEANASIAFPVNQWNIGIGVWNAAAKRVGVSINGGAWTTDVNASAVLDQNAFIVSNGLLDDDWIMDVIYGSADLSDSANADLLTLIKAWARDKRGIEVA